MAISSQEIRQRAIAAYEAGSGSQSQLAALFGISRPTMERWVRAYRTEGRLSPKPRGHRKAVYQGQDLQTLNRLVEQNPDRTLDELRDRTGKSCSIMAVHRALVELGWSFKKRRYVRVSKTERT